MFFEKKCKICGFSSDFSDFFVGKRRFLLCSNCNSVLLDENFFVNEQEQKNRYELHNNSLDDDGYKNYLEKFFSVSLNLAFGKESVSELDFLDYGSGPVPCLAELIRQKNIFASVSFYDLFFAPNLVENKKFDFVTCLEVAEHFENPIDDFSKISNLLKNDGKIAIQTQFLENSPCFVENKFCYDKFCRWWYKEDCTHVSFYTKKGIFECVKRVGLEVFAEEKNLVIFRKV